MARTSRQLRSWLAVSATPPQWSTALAAARLAARRRGAAKRTARWPDLAALPRTTTLT